MTAATVTATSSTKIAIYAEAADGCTTDALDARLRALRGPGFGLDLASRPQHADVALMWLAEAQTGPEAGVDAAMVAAISSLRARCVGAPVLLVAGSLSSALQPYASALGADDALGLDEADTAWLRTLRWASRWQREQRAHNETRLAYRQAVRGAGRGGWAWDLQSNVVRFDPAWKATLGYADDEFGADIESWFLRVHPADRPNLSAAFDPLLQGTGRRMELDLRLQHRDRRYLWVRCQGELRQDDLGLRVEGTQLDISAEKASDARLLAATTHDRLTGALGREAFLEALAARMTEPDRPFALGLCDIDDLKALNLRWGRSAGDEVLVWTAGMLEDRCGQPALIGRVGSDAFAFVVDGEDVVAHANWLAAARDELTEERFVGRHGAEFRVVATFAMTARPASVGDPSDLLRLADRGIDQARRSGEGLLLVPAAQGALAFQATDVFPAVSLAALPSRASDRSR